MAHCRHWSKHGTCYYGDSCVYIHDQEHQGKRAAVLGRDLDVEVALQHTGASHSRSGRAGTLRRWIIDTFGRETLRKGVLDIAGGKGELAFELVALNRVPCVSVDPRPLDTDRYEAKLLRGLYHRTKPLLHYIDVGIPQHVGAIPKVDRVQVYWSPRVWTEPSVVPSGVDEAPWNRLQEAIVNLGLVIGLHPDQATESIIDFALSRSLSFAVVPCCTFWKHAQHRTIHGKQVRTYAQYIAYLSSKHPDIAVQCLDMEGRNLVLYRRTP